MCPSPPLPGPSLSWYRGRVVDYSPSSREYQVFFVDYGELQWVGETEVQAISESFLELPCQAVRACLAGLELSEWGVGVGGRDGVGGGWKG